MNKKVLIIAGCAAGVLALAGGITAAIVLNTPESLLLRAAANTVKDYKSLEWYQIMDDVANGGSVELSANLAPVSDDISDDLYLSAKFYENAGKGNGALVMSLQDEDKESLATFNAAYDKNALTLCFPEADDEVYGFDLKNIEDNIEGSPFDPEEYDPYDYYGNNYKYAVFGNYLLNLGSNVEADTQIQQKAEKLGDKYRELFIKELIANTDVSKSSETVSIGSESISCNVVTVEMDEEQLANVLLNVIEYAEDDEELEEYVELLAANGNSELYNEDYEDEFYNGLDEMKDSIEEDLDDTELDITVRFYISKAGTKLVQVDLEAESEYDGDDYYTAKSSSVEMTIAVGKKLDGVGEKSITYSFETEYESRKEEDSGEIVFEIEQNDKNAFIATLSIETSEDSTYYDWDDTYTNDTEAEVEFNWDKKSGEFTIEYQGVKDDWQDSDPSFSIEFTMLDNGDTRTIVLEDIDYNSGYDYSYDDDEILKTIEDMEITIIFDRNDKAPAPEKNFTELTDLDEEDIDEILEEYGEELEDILKDYGIDL
ncbi:MAG: hypothetical protein J5776_06415 [Clostridiales bacterium]|nr:hypothetical protein [Clostridiales bacterium]